MIGQSNLSLLCWLLGLLILFDTLPGPYGPLGWRKCKMDQNGHISKLWPGALKIPFFTSKTPLKHLTTHHFQWEKSAGWGISLILGRHIEQKNKK